MFLQQGLEVFQYHCQKCTTMQCHICFCSKEEENSAPSLEVGEKQDSGREGKFMLNWWMMIYMNAYYGDIYICQNIRQVPALLDDHHVDLDDVHSHHDSLLASLHSHRIWHQRLQWIISTLMLDRTRIFKRQQFSIKPIPASTHIIRPV